MTDPRETGSFVETVPEGDNRARKVCRDCGHVDYENPKVVVGAVCVWEDSVLLCRRAIEPRIGYWTIPAGFMELDEGTAEGAAREALEEACVRLHMGSLIGIYEIPRIGHVYIVYSAELVAPEFAPGPESQEVALFAWPDIPWDNLAFPSVTWALRRYREGGAPLVHKARDEEWIY